MKNSILIIKILAALGGIAVLSTTAAKSNAQQITTSFAKHQTGFKSTVCIKNQPCQSIEMIMHSRQTKPIKKDEEITNTLLKIEDPFSDILPEFKLDVGDF